MRPILANTRDWPKLERLLLLAVTGLLLLACAWTLARFVGLFLTQSGNPSTGPAVFNPQGAEIPSESSIAGYHLFGAVPGEPGGDALARNAPETELDLVLHGTFAAEDQDQALAIIADGTGNERSYAVGAELPGSASLYRVYPDRVLLRTGEGVEALSLRQPESEPSAPRQAGAAPRSGHLNVIQPASDTDWAALRRSMLADPARIARNVSALPVQQDGELIGFRLRPGRDAALLTQLGLRQSDVIIAVNGIELDDYNKAGEVLAELQTASQLNVTVLRNGQRQQLTIPLEQ